MRIMRLIIYEGNEDRINKTLERSYKGTQLIPQDLYLTAEVINESDSTIQSEISRIIELHETNLLNLKQK